MKFIKYLLIIVILAILAGLWYFNRIQWGGGPPMGPMPVLVAPVEATSFQPSFTQTGRLSAVAEAEVRPQVAGVIEKINFAEGQLVAQGQALFTLDLRAYGAQTRQAAAQYTQAKAAYTRGVKLRAADAISVADLEARKAAYQAAAATVSEAGVTGTRAIVKAPIAGRVGRAELTVGALVNPAALAALTTVQQTNQLYIDFDMDEQTYLTLAGQGSLRGTQVAVGLAGQSGAGGAAYPLTAILTGLDNRLGTSTGGLRLRATINNPEGMLIPGLFARVKVNLPQTTEALLVNDAAVGTDQTLRFLYKIGASGQPERVVVMLGEMVNGLRVVKPVAVGALNAGERVVINGLMRIRPGSEVTPMPADMRTLQPVSGTQPAPQTKAAE